MVSGPEAQPVMAYWTPRVSKRASAEAKHARKRTSFIEHERIAQTLSQRKGALASSIYYTVMKFLMNEASRNDRGDRSQIGFVNSARLQVQVPGSTFQQPSHSSRLTPFLPIESTERQRLSVACSYFVSTLTSWISSSQLTFSTATSVRAPDATSTNCSIHL